MWDGDHQTTEKDGKGKGQRHEDDWPGTRVCDDTDSRRSSRIYDLPRFSLSMFSYEAKNRTENKPQRVQQDLGTCR